MEVTGAGQAEAEIQQDIVYHKVGKEKTVISLSEVKAEKGSSYIFALDLEYLGGYKVEMTAKSSLGELAQLPATLICGGVPHAVFTFNGTGGEWVSLERSVAFKGKYNILQLYFGQNGLDLKEICFTIEKPLLDINDLEALEV